MLTSWHTVPVEKRHSVLKLLTLFCDEAREIEAAIHDTSRDLHEYTDKAQQIAFNVKQNPDLIRSGAAVVHFTDKKMAENTIIQDIAREGQNRRMRFEKMLQEKYDMLNDKSFTSTLKCRRCGSAEVSWEQKQTRSADEASTVFCTCNKCNNRWTMR